MTADSEMAARKPKPKSADAKSAPIDPESYTEIFAGFLSEPSAALRFAIQLLRAGILPSNARAYLADRLEALASGIDGARAFGLARGPGAPSNRNDCIGVLYEVMRQKERLRSSHSEQAAAALANEAVAKLRGMSVKTVKNLASEARRRCRAQGIDIAELPEKLGLKASR